MILVHLFTHPSLGSLASGPSSYEVASPASQELYVFDANGTHQFTMSLVTGDYKFNFSYRLVCCALTRLWIFFFYILAFNVTGIVFNLTPLLIFFFLFKVSSIFTLSFLAFALPLSNEEDVTAVTDSSGNTLRIRRDTNRMPVRVVAPDNQVFVCFLILFIILKLSDWALMSTGLFFQSSLLVKMIQILQKVAHLHWCLVSISLLSMFVRMCL